MKKICLLLLLLVSNVIIAQEEIQTFVRNDSIVMKYFNPKFVGQNKEYEAGLSLYKNITNNLYTLALSVVFKDNNPIELYGNLIIDLGENKIVNLEPVFHKVLNPNGKVIESSLFYLSENDIKFLEKFPLQKIIFKVNNDTIILNVTYNKNIFIDEYLVLSPINK